MVLSESRHSKKKKFHLVNKLVCQWKKKKSDRRCWPTPPCSHNMKMDFKNLTTPSGWSKLASAPCTAHPSWYLECEHHLSTRSRQWDIWLCCCVWNHGDHRSTLDEWHQHITKMPEVKNHTKSKHLQMLYLDLAMICRGSAHLFCEIIFDSSLKILLLSHKKYSSLISTEVYWNLSQRWAIDY